MTTGNATEERTYIHGIPLVDLPKYPHDEPIGDKVVERADEINFALLDEILEYIQKHPLQWRQEAWFKIVDLETGLTRYESEETIVEEKNSCGAAFCFAGHVALRKGFPAPPLDSGLEWDRKVKFIDDDREGFFYEPADEFAMKILGLSSGQANALFDGDNAMEEIEDIIAALKLNPELEGYELNEIKWRDYRHTIPLDQFMKDEGYVTDLPF